MTKKKKDESPEQENINAEETETQAAPEDKNDTAGKTTQQEAEDLIKKAEEALSAEKDRFLRLAAEYDNYRKRSVKEREALYTDIRCDTVIKFLPVYDNLARALKQDTTDQAFCKGVEMTMSQLKGIFEKLGVTEIEAVGQKFDPERHNAVMHVEDENAGENEIVEEFEKGFMLGDKVIRFSVVKVAN